MKKIDNFDKIHANVMKVMSPFLISNNFEEVKAKCENCQKMGRIMGETPDCYSCLLANPKARDGLDNVIDNTPLNEVVDYQDKIASIAERKHKARYRFLYEVLESAMYTRML